MKIGCILMAAGSGERFRTAGGAKDEKTNKLFAEFGGEKLYERALAAIPADEFFRVAVVSGYADILNRANALGFTPVLNDRPEDGASRTIRLGLDALTDADAVLFMAADQPLLSRATVAAEADFFRRNYRADAGNGLIVALGFGARRGSPVIFSREYFAELNALMGDMGGRRVIAAHEDALTLFAAENELELADVDSPEELEFLGDNT